MEENRQEDDSMDIERPENPSFLFTAHGSPSYSPPEPDEHRDEGRDVKDHYDASEEEESKQERTTRNKAKRKAKVFLPQEKVDDNGEVEEEEEEERLARRKAKGKGRAYVPIEVDNNDGQERPIGLRRSKRPNPLSLNPTAAGDTEMDMDAYRVGYRKETRFGDADAAMNETISSLSPSPPSSENNENGPYTTPDSRNPLTMHRNFTTLDMPSMIDKLATLEKQQGDGGWGQGRGRGRGQGWGLEWKESVTEEKVQHEEWPIFEDPDPAPAEDTRWQVYNASAWEKATEKAEGQEVGKMTLEKPPVKKEQGSIKRTTDPNTVKSEDQGLEIVQAVRDYKAILRGTFLSYEKGDVMKVLYRDRDGRLLDCSRVADNALHSHVAGKLFTLLPLKNPKWSGRAHTKDFVLLFNTDRGVRS